MGNKENYLKIKLLVTIINKENEEELIDLYSKYELLFHFVIQGYGLAKSATLKHLGLDEIEKRVTFSIIPEDIEEDIYTLLLEQFKIKEPGRGIAFTIPITSSSIYFANDANYRRHKKMTDDKKYELILTVVTDGYADQIMDLARSLGATGGTLMSGKGLGSVEATKFLGITIQPEKNIILILADTKYKHEVMEAIVKEFGITTRAKGLCFSLPVDKTIGIDEKILKTSEIK